MRRNNTAFRLPASLFEEARKTAELECVSLSRFVNLAVAEKLSPLRTEEFFRERAARAPGRVEALRILERIGRNNPPMPGDGLPPGWTGWNNRPAKKSNPKRRAVKSRRTA